jgi:hypothetical protein
MALAGTSFAAPIVAAAAAWVRAERPGLSVDQVAQVIRLGARDVGTPGWSSDTGFGILDVGGALARTPPRRDPLEPNEDIMWVDGSAFGRPDRFVSKGAGASLRALLDRFEDPTDVYRVRFPGRSRLRITVRPGFGDPDLRVVRRGARTIADDAFVVAQSRRRGGRTERVVVRNAGRKRRVAFVAVYIPETVRQLDASYTLRVKRVRRR